MKAIFVSSNMTITVLKNADNTCGMPAITTYIRDAGRIAKRIFDVFHHHDLKI